ncbi:HlyD family type I secretion periplasmic adaptor subunit [Duganella violaceipulchra]|uniref:Membrane fusion protein (MFP) family protein n=1 Tax=Duganella violaceipulchra TaxID=2849652 RepID=A0AA41H5Z7_9BURK|nr:HlyD family type I secretion periplasmic adaptor subunit [Duganella violaceicalia]MBV6322473.1 HlyD family type I secretion periplasmic adaptor subunit [Duganella violaceicalia]MCP2010678.1 RTX toxin transport system membrane fusion protein [Duganella violaceicalia]
MKLKTFCAAWADRLRNAGDRARPDSSYEFLPGHLEILHRPASPWARGVALSLALLLLLALVWAIVGRLDIHASAAGQVIASSRSKVIQPLEQAEVVAIRVGDGQRVKAGQVLLDLKLVGAGADTVRLHEQLAFNQLEKSRFLALLANDPIAAFVPPDGADPAQVANTRLHLADEWQVLRARMQDLESEIQVNTANQQATVRDLDSLDKVHTNVATRMNSLRKLEEQGMVSRVGLLEKDKEQLDIEQRQVQQSAQQKVLRAQELNLADRKRTYLAQTRRDYADKLTQANNAIIDLQQKLAKAVERQDLQSLRSPVDGVVQQLAVHTVGGVVTPAQVLMIVVPDATELEAEVNLLNQDVGFTVPGQPVAVKVDAFPYSRYGTVPATLSFVSHDAVKDERLGYVFPARVRLTQDYIMVDGRRMPLQPGMSVVAEVKTDTRRVIDYLLSPVREYQATAMRER